MIVAWPTSTPATSVIAFSGPGRPVERHAERAGPWLLLGHQRRRQQGKHHAGHGHTRES